jgi:hypothetical protein
MLSCLRLSLPCDQALEMGVQVGTQLGIVTSTHDGTSHHNEVHAAVIRNLVTERFPRQTLDAITVNCARQLFFGNCQTQPGGNLRLPPTRQDSEISVGRFQRLFEHSPKVGGIEQSLLTWKGMRQGVAPKGLGLGYSSRMRSFSAYRAKSACQACTALGTAGIDHLAASAGSHAGTETVSANTLQIAWLKCTFHGLDPGTLNVC